MYPIFWERFRIPQYTALLTPLKERLFSQKFRGSIRGVNFLGPLISQKIIFFEKINLQIFRYWSEVKFFENFFGAHPARAAQNPG